MSSGQRFSLLACDYDGTLATHGTVDNATLRALQQLRASGRKLVLVTGRQLDDLRRLFPHLYLFDRVVAENGAVLAWNGSSRALACPPPQDFIAALKARDVVPLSAGEVIVATDRSQLEKTSKVVCDLDLDVDLILNKDALMVLPAGVNKGWGLQHVLAELGVAAENTVAIGDAENDEPMLRTCGYGVAVANALPLVKNCADLVTAGANGAGVVEFIEQVLRFR